MGAGALDEGRLPKRRSRDNRVEKRRMIDLILHFAKRVSQQFLIHLALIDKSF